MKRLRMNTGLCGPEYNLVRGDEHDFEDDEADRLIAAGFATEIEDTNAAAKNEAAEKAAAEKAAAEKEAAEKEAAGKAAAEKAATEKQSGKKPAKKG